MVSRLDLAWIFAASLLQAKTRNTTLFSCHVKKGGKNRLLHLKKHKEVVISVFGHMMGSEK